MKFFGSLTRLVAAVFRKNGQDITLRPNQSTTYTAARDIQTPPQDANSVLVSENASQAITNKTVVVASNTVTTAASGNLAATELNAALAELQGDIDTRALDSALTAHINDTTDAHDASAISNVPAGNLAATDVQGALNELQSDVDTRATVTYVDNLVAGLRWKQPARAASTANVDISADLENGDTLDGVTLATGDRVLLKDQTASEENGIYVVPASGAASRASDANSAAELNSAAIFVQEGTANANKGFVETAEIVTLGTDPVTFANFTAGQSYTADETTITLSGNQFSVKAGGISNTHIAAAAAIAYSKLAALTASRALQSGAGGFIEVSAVTSTELGHLSGVTSAIQTQLTAKVDEFSDDWTSGTTKTVTHNLGTRDVQVSIREIDSPYELLMVDTIQATTTSAIDLSSSEAPSGSGWRVTVQAK